MRLETMTVENWLAIMGGVLAIVATLMGLHNKSVKGMIKADISGPLAKLEANYENMCSSMDEQRIDANARADMHARRLEEMQRDTRSISERVTSLEEWRRSGSGAYPPFRSAANG